MPISALNLVLSEREYTKWLSYEMYKYPDANELQMARLTLLVAQGLGGKNLKIEDFMINDPKKFNKPKAKVMSTESVRSAFSMLAKRMN